MGKLVLFVALTSFFTTTFSHLVNAAEGIDDSLRAELLKMKDTEQKLRNMLDSVRRNFGERSPEMKQLWVAIHATDSLNTWRLKTIVAVKGFPGNSMVGADGARAAFLILQHSDNDCCIQEEFLPMIEQAAKNSDFEWQYVAYLTDRIRVFKKKQPQLYGTQLKQENGIMVPFPIEDEENVDVRRKEMGMRLLSEYLELVNGNRK